MGGSFSNDEFWDFTPASLRTPTADDVQKLISTSTSQRELEPEAFAAENFPEFGKSVVGPETESWFKQHEGKNTNESGRHIMYKDGSRKGNWTIGYGHKIQPSEMARFANGLSEEEALALMYSDMRSHEQDARMTYDDMLNREGAWNQLPTKARRALLDVSYNPGLGTFPQLVKAVDAYSKGEGNFENVRKNILDRYVTLPGRTTKEGEHPRKFLHARNIAVVQLMLEAFEPDDKNVGSVLDQHYTRISKEK